MWRVLVAGVLIRDVIVACARMWCARDVCSWFALAAFAYARGVLVVCTRARACGVRVPVLVVCS